MKAALIPVGGKPRLINIESDEGSYLHSLQNLVGGLIEPYDVLYGSSPLLWVNEEGLYTQAPNRAIYANEHSVSEGYLSSESWTEVVKLGELMTVLHGDIVAVSYDFDEYGEEIERDITDEEFNQLCKDFDEVNSGELEEFRIFIKAKIGLSFSKEELRSMLGLNR